MCTFIISGCLVLFDSLKLMFVFFISLCWNKMLKLNWSRPYWLFSIYKNIERTVLSLKRYKYTYINTNTYFASNPYIQTYFFVSHLLLIRQIMHSIWKHQYVHRFLIPIYLYSLWHKLCHNIWTIEDLVRLINFSIPGKLVLDTDSVLGFN